jgi:SagB-type dehydrogenase family enzyme
MNSNSDIVINYHHRTKHSLQRYARGPEALDWEDQPNGFRTFTGCEIIKLPKPGAEREVLFSDLAKPRQAETLSNISVGLLLELAFGLSAWKQFGTDRWALRCNPSSGNLHPTEAYLINTDTSLFPTGIYHYHSYEHGLEQRCVFKQPLEKQGIFIGLSSVHWREAWKYGERAFRYCQHDIGHALACLRYAAAVLGWSVELIAECSDEELSALLGISRAEDFKADEREYADILCKIQRQDPTAEYDLDNLIQAANTGLWQGKAQQLNEYHLYKWTVISEVAKAAEKPRTERIKSQTAMSLSSYSSSCQQRATSVIRQRRSAQNFNPKASLLAQQDFYQILAATLPDKLPFDIWPFVNKIHLFIFVHRVEGLEPGLYALPRNADKLTVLQAATSAKFEWQALSAPLPLYKLLTVNCRNAAKTLSCHQAIASDSAFSLAMVAEFSETVEAAAWQYRHLFWEAGIIGQVLYLEAEAAGIRGTGIGCYFDDSVHEVLGFTDATFQSLYHFTVGTPLIDPRLQTLPAYFHLSSSSKVF